MCSSCCFQPAPAVFCAGGGSSSSARVNSILQDAAGVVLQNRQGRWRGWARHVGPRRQPVAGLGSQMTGGRCHNHQALCLMHLAPPAAPAGGHWHALRAPSCTPLVVHSTSQLEAKLAARAPCWQSVVQCLRTEQTGRQQLGGQSCVAPRAAAAVLLVWLLALRSGRCPGASSTGTCLLFQV